LPTYSGAWSPSMYIGNGCCCSSIEAGCPGCSDPAADGLHTVLRLSSAFDRWGLWGIGTIFDIGLLVGFRLAGLCHGKIEIIPQAPLILAVCWATPWNGPLRQSLDDVEERPYRVLLQSRCKTCMHGNCCPDPAHFRFWTSFHKRGCGRITEKADTIHQGGGEIDDKEAASFAAALLVAAAVPVSASNSRDRTIEFVVHGGATFRHDVVSNRTLKTIIDRKNLTGFACRASTARAADVGSTTVRRHMWSKKGRTRM